MAMNSDVSAKLQVSVLYYVHKGGSHLTGILNEQRRRGRPKNSWRRSAEFNESGYSWGLLANMAPNRVRWNKRNRL